MGTFSLMKVKPDPDFNTVFTVTRAMEESFMPFLMPEYEFSVRTVLEDGMIELKINLSKEKMDALRDAVNVVGFKFNMISEN